MCGIILVSMTAQTFSCAQISSLARKLARLAKFIFAVWVRIRDKPRREYPQTRVSTISLGPLRQQYETNPQYQIAYPILVKATASAQARNLY